jgi:O-antigen ligase
MPENDLLQWLQTRGFYALVILALLMIGLLLALARRRDARRDRNASARRPPRRGRSGARRFK